MLHLSLAERIMKHRRARKRGCSGENPLPSRAWKHLSSELQAEEDGKPYWQRKRLDQCRTNLRGPQGGLHRKATGIFTSDEEIAEAVDLQCDGSHQHEQVQGRATKASETYTRELGMIAARKMVNTHRRGGTTHPRRATTLRRSAAGGILGPGNR